MIKPLPDATTTPLPQKKIPIVFLTICLLAFAVSVITTAYYAISMSGDMKMPGGWSMSMMWMRMPGETWLSSAITFTVMWLAMMVAMMLPSALPMFLKTGGRWNFLCSEAAGYFTIWLIGGLGIYALSMIFASAAMQSALLSQAVPLLFGMVLLLAGCYQFSHLKITQLLHCRSSFGCAISTAQHVTGFELGCRQGVVCCLCCSGLMIAQLILGIMDPVIMIAIAVAIILEKIFPRPDVTVRLIGITLMIAGIIIILRWAMFITK